MGMEFIGFWEISINCTKKITIHTHKFPIGVSHKTPPCNTPHKKGGRSFLALLMKYL